MTDEPEYYSIHDQMRDLVLETEKKIIEQPKLNELDDIRKSLKYILDKMSSMDRYIRSSQYRYGGTILDGETYKNEVIKQFFIDLKNRKYTDDELKLLSRDDDFEDSDIPS